MFLQCTCAVQWYSRHLQMSKINFLRSPPIVFVYNVGYNYIFLPPPPLITRFFRRMLLSKTSFFTVHMSLKPRLVFFTLFFTAAYIVSMVLNEINHPAIKWYSPSLSHWNLFPMGRSYISIFLHNQIWNHSTWINKSNSSNLCYIKAWIPLSTFWEGYIQPPSRPWFLTNAISLIVSHLVRLGPGASVNLVTGMGPLPCSQKIHFYAVQISSSSKLWLEETEKNLLYSKLWYRSSVPTVQQPDSWIPQPFIHIIETGATVDNLHDQGVHSIYQLLLFPFHLFSLTLFLLLCFIVGEEVADYDTLQ